MNIFIKYSRQCEINLPMKKENNPQKYKDTGLLLGRLVRGL